MATEQGTLGGGPGMVPIGSALGARLTAESADAIGVSANGTVALPLRAVAAPAAARPRVGRGWLVRRLLLMADVLGLLTAFLVTGLIFGAPVIDSFGATVVVFVIAIPSWGIGAKLRGLYDHDDERARHSTTDEFASVFGLVTLGVWLFYALSWVFGVVAPAQERLSTFWLLAILGVISSRAGARAIARRQDSYRQNTIIVGAGKVGQLVGRKILQHSEYGINLLGFVDGEPTERREDLRHLALLGQPDEIVEIVRDYDVERVIIAFSNDSHEELLHVVHRLREHNLQIDVVPRLFDAVNPNVGIHTLEGLPLLSLPPSRISRTSRWCKRGVDIVVSSVLLALTAPLMLLVAFLIRRDSPGPVFYRQVRLGMDMHEFTVLKFRTMYVGTDAEAHKAYIQDTMDSSAIPASNNLYKLDRPDSTTRVGRWLRATSLDELPQLLNVLRGDMSLVGPRPCIPYETEFFEPHHFERFLVPAGLTGLWQVEARAHSTFGEALQFDVAYARGWSLGLDLRLLVRTPFVALRKLETR